MNLFYTGAIDSCLESKWNETEIKKDQPHELILKSMKNICILKK